MGKYEVKVEAVVTYEVTVHAENGAQAARIAEDAAPPEGQIRVESARELWVRDITPIEEQIDGWVRELQARGYSIRSPKKDKESLEGKTGDPAERNPDASGTEASDSDIQEDEAAGLQQGPDAGDD